MYKRVAIVTFPSQELERPPAAPAVLGGLCRHMGIDYTVFDINLQLAKKLTTELLAHCAQQATTSASV